MLTDNNYSYIEKLVNNGSFSTPRCSATVVIPFYKGLEILDRTLASLTLQTYPRSLWNVIVVEDGSPEPSTELIKKYSDRLDITRVRQEREGFRLATARNLGIRLASRDVIILIDFDIVCLPEHLYSHLRWFQSDFPVATFGLREFIDLQNLAANDIANWINELPSFTRVPSVSNRLQTLDKRLFEIPNIKSHPFPCNCFHGCNVAFLRKDALAVGLFDTEFDGYPGYEDIEFAYRLQQLGRYIVYEPQVKVYHQENQVVSLDWRQQGQLVNLERLYKKVPDIRQYRRSLENMSLT